MSFRALVTWCAAAVLCACAQSAASEYVPVEEVPGPSLPPFEEPQPQGMTDLDDATSKVHRSSAPVTTPTSLDRASTITSTSPTAPRPALVDDAYCATPDGQIGRCVRSCPHLVQLLASEPKSLETERFVHDSRCENGDSLSVCCGESPPRKISRFVPSKECKSGAAPPDPRTGCCGRHPEGGNRISGGEDTGIDQYPWLALIEYQGQSLKLLCGGALISGLYVLTAAHCVVGNTILSLGTPVNVRLGEYNTGNSIKEEDCVPAEGGGLDCARPPVVIPIERIVAHHHYTPWDPNKRNDIALIRMKFAAPYTDFIRPICLPLEDVTLAPPEDLVLTVAGWGALSDLILRSKIKQHVLLPYYNFTECQAIYRRISKNTELWNKQVCAGGESGKDSCTNDSGGPLMYLSGHVVEAVGVVSFGPAKCGLAGVPSIYTKVYEYNTWIRTHIRP